MTMYTPDEVSKLKALYLNLVAMNHIKVDELDAWGNPVPLYTAEAKRQLVAAITACKGFGWRCQVENASRLATPEAAHHLYAAYCMMDDNEGALKDFWQAFTKELNEAALLELTESLFTPAQIIEMLVTHVDYLDLLQDARRRGRLEDEDTKDRHFTIVREHAA